MVFIDYCILTMEIMEIYQTTIPKYVNGKGFWIFPTINQEYNKKHYFFNLN
jgi:hypothetical protein